MKEWLGGIGQIVIGGTLLVGALAAIGAAVAHWGLGVSIAEVCGG